MNNYRYTLNPQILKKIKKIYLMLQEIGFRKISDVVLFELQTEARHLSSYSSTSIEGNPLPLTEVKKILKNRPAKIRDTEREVLQYNETLLYLQELVQNDKFELNLKTLLKVHEKLMEGLLPDIKLKKLRQEPVVVNDPIKRKVMYYPPDHKDVQNLLKELLGFCHKHKDEIDPLILAAIFHKQFVIIHPFIDGNGRSVRLLTKSYLASMGVDTFSLFSFEAYYNNNVTLYFQKVGERGDFYDLAEKLDFTDWIEYFCDGIIDELFRVQKFLDVKTTSKYESPNEKISNDQKLILDFLEKNGIIQDCDYQTLTSRAKSTRVLDFNKLISIGKIEKHGVGKGTYYKLKSKTKL